MGGLESRALRVPAPVEFLARCGLVARRRCLPARGRPKANPAPAAAPDPVPAGALAEALSGLGIRPGAVLMVHSSAEAVGRLGWEPSGLIDFLLDYLGPDGTLAMPTHPKLFERDGKVVYDVRRSPSKVGMVTELFRRRRGVCRSRFPFSAAAAIGRHAAELTAGHARSFAPHDEHSPYARLGDLGGQVLAVGCPVDRMTILHVAEDVLRGELALADFHRPSVVWVKEGDETGTVTAHTRAPWLWWYLHLSGWAHNMYRHGLARTRQVAGVPLHAAEAGPAIEWMKDELRAGRSIYPLARMNRWLRLGDPRAERETP